MIPLTVNTQPRERRLPAGRRREVEVHSIFLTIQGEGPLTGTPAVFLRLAGCNLTCPKCDTEYTQTRIVMTPDEVLTHIRVAFNRVQSHSRKLVVVTGGEPFRQDNLGAVVETLLRCDYRVQIETNGTLMPEWLPRVSYGSFFIVCSPKAVVHDDLHYYIESYKYILRAGEVDPDDGLPLTTMGMTCPVGRPRYKGSEVFVQPLDEGDPEANKRNLEACVRSCLEYGYRLSVQTHKIAGVP